jgi:hypothetical protein
MVVMIKNLWPTEIDNTNVTPPVTILNQQATMLGTVTKNIILGDVKARESEEYDFSYIFYIVAPALSNYRYKLLTIWHNIDLYPVIIQVEENIYNEISPSDKDKTHFAFLIEPPEMERKIPNSFQAKSEDEFLEVLEAIFNTSKTKRIISALRAQSTDNYKVS